MPDPATDVKMDLIGSELTKGFVIRRYDRGVRMGRVTNALNTTQGLNDAIDCTYTYLKDHDLSGRFHQSITNLPLARISAKKRGDDSAWVFAYYDRRYNVDETNPVTAAKFRTGLISRKWYQKVWSEVEGKEVWTTSGLPGGDLISHKDQYIHEAVMAYDIITTPIVKVMFPAVSNTNPVFDLSGMVGHINDAAFPLGGIGWPAGMVRYDSCDVEHRSSELHNYYDLVYRFTISLATWAKQGVVYFNGQWIPVTESMFPPATFESWGASGLLGGRS